MFRQMLLSALLAVLARDAMGAGLPDTSKMNILFLNIEDCNAGVWGCYGNPICKTPNIDRFARTAVRFDSAYCQAVSCNPSRTSFLTGLRPPTTRVFSNNDVMDKMLPPGVVTMPEILKAAGFTTADVGKLFHSLDYAEKRMLAFDRIEMHDKPEGWTGPPPILSFPPQRPGWEDAPKDHDSPEYRQWKHRYSDRYGDSGLAREQEYDYQMAATAAALLKEFAREKTRFFLAVSQSKPHTPLIAPRSYVAMYDPSRIPAPPAPPDRLINFPGHYLKRARAGNHDIFLDRSPTPREAQAAIAAYYACVSFVDDNIGMILDALDRTGLADSTIVVFLGDHGFHLGDHGFWSKYSMLEATRRAPLIVRVPGASGNGRVCREFVEFVDLLPTLGSLAHTELPTNLEGTSFAPLLAEPDRPWKQAIFMSGGSDDAGQMVRNRRYSYLEFKKSNMPAALFDLEQDPWETNNLIDDPAHAGTRRTMAAMLQAGWRSALPAATESPAGR